MATRQKCDVLPALNPLNIIDVLSSFNAYEFLNMSWLKALDYKINLNDKVRN